VTWMTSVAGASTGGDVLQSPIATGNVHSSVFGLPRRPPRSRPSLIGEHGWCLILDGLGEHRVAVGSSPTVARPLMVWEVPREFCEA
jgi:hypothetical protein